MSYIIARDELKSGLYVALLIPWSGIEFPEERVATVDALSEQLADVLDACADPDEALVAIRAAVPHG
jgi:hypothetical protein